LLGFGGCEVDIEYKNVDGRKKIDQQTDKGVESLYLYHGDEPLVGVVNVKVKPGKKVDYNSVKIEFIGEIEFIYDRTIPYEFTSNVHNVYTEAGTIRESCSFDFNFETVEKNFESYNGVNVRLRYFVRFTISRSFASNIVKEKEIWIINYTPTPDLNPTIKMEVGIEDCLHIEYEYTKSKYHLKDVVIGKVFFLLVRINIKYMEIALIKKESTGTGPNNIYNENETITKYEIMDGSPVKGESIPIRLFLSGFDLSPTYKNIHNKFSVKYYLNVVIVDEEDRRYFKQTEVIIYRKKPGEDTAPVNNMIRLKDENRKRKKKKTKNNIQTQTDEKQE